MISETKDISAVKHINVEKLQPAQTHAGPTHKKILDIY